MLLLCCDGLVGQFRLIEQKRVGTVMRLSMALIGLLLQWLCLIGCKILDDLQHRRTKKEVAYRRTEGTDMHHFLAVGISRHLMIPFTLEDYNVIIKQLSMHESFRFLNIIFSHCVYFYNIAFL